MSPSSPDGPWTADLVSAALVQAYRHLMTSQMPVVAGHGSWRPAGWQIGNVDVVAPLGWVDRYLGIGSEQLKFIIRHVRWIAEGVPIRERVISGSPVWRQRRMSWSAYMDKRVAILKVMADGLNRDGVPLLAHL